MWIEKTNYSFYNPIAKLYEVHNAPNPCVQKMFNQSFSFLAKLQKKIILKLYISIINFSVPLHPEVKVNKN